jgi:hypothetical protein
MAIATSIWDQPVSLMRDALQQYTNEYLAKHSRAKLADVAHIRTLLGVPAPVGPPVVRGGWMAERRQRRG